MTNAVGMLNKWGVHSLAEPPWFVSGGPDPLTPTIAAYGCNELMCTRLRLNCMWGSNYIAIRTEATAYTLS
jgi:hypothetical protein